ncbi:MAG: 1-deoxy-D-xylulose-5-phosphate synthase [Ruminococcaceae bacterium]|nr:1-deoxy-D-xylulose-5-phosphate synthase [Oscillospiraceae bacterium]
MILEKIKSPKELKALSISELTALSGEVRKALLKKLSIHGGHFGSNFGIVEATIALHYVFNSPKDKLIFDVSHQSYTHKILTGRAEAFLDESKYNDYSGYSAPYESEHDVFTMGHTSTSVSLALGLAKARDLLGEDNRVVAIIGDGSLSGGEALEALNYAGEFDGSLIIVVNDNDMSIAENHGGMYKNLKELRDSNGRCESNIFKNFGLDYMYVDNGNDIATLIDAFESVKDTDHPIVVHIKTQKGKGYAVAEIEREGWHATAPFDIETGNRLYSKNGADSYSDITALHLLKRMKEDKSIVSITAATPTVAGFTKERRDIAGAQFIDVGIAEENALAMASGIAKAGAKPVWAVNSTFLQRTYDQMSHDVCLNSSPVTTLVFASSIYCKSDVTHIGIYDIPMISNIPNLKYLAPTCKEEYLAMLDWSIDQSNESVAIKVPASKAICSGKVARDDYSKCSYDIVRWGNEVAILALGSFFSLGEEVCNALEAKGINATLVNPLFINELDTLALDKIGENHSLVITLEDGILDGGFGEKIARYYGNTKTRVINYGLKKEFPIRYTLEGILEENRLTTPQIVEDILKSK